MVRNPMLVVQSQLSGRQLFYSERYELNVPDVLQSGEETLWTTPIYKFRIPVDGEPEQLREIVIDVTASAPPFKEPSDDLKEVLREVFKSFKTKTVVEFGAGKLKNIPFILDQGKTVSAVDFKELSQNPFTKKNLRK